MNTTRRFVLPLFLAVLLAVTAAAQEQHPLSRGGYSIFHETMVDMSYDQVEQAAKDNAVVLWPLGVIEEHGPHLPLGTDIYNSYIRMKDLSRRLNAGGIKAIVAPPLYWGINEATGAFGGSFILRPSTLVALIEDTFFSLRKDGFQTVYITTGHGDRLHNKTIVDAVEHARATTGLRGFVIVNKMMADRLGLRGDEAHIVLVPGGPGAPAGPAQPGAQQAGPPQNIEVHAGAGESGTVWLFFPSLVNVDVMRSLEPSNYGLADLAEWRKGWDNARQKTPLGYFGDPAAADLERARRSFEGQSRATAEAVAAHIRSSLWNRQNQAK